MQRIETPVESTSDASSASDGNATDQHGPRQWMLRRWGFRSLLLIVGLLLLLGGTPWLVSCRWCHDWLLGQASHNINGHFAVDQLKLGWFSPPHLKAFEIYPENGPPLVVLPDLDTEVAFCRFWISGTDLGTWVLDEPQVRLHVDPDGTNFAKTFIRPSPLVERVAKAMVHDHRFAAQIVAGRFVFSRDDQPSWSIDDIHATVGFSPPTPHDPSPHVSLQPGTLLNQLELSPSMCNDLLKFVAPVLADTSWVEGRVSLDLEHVDIPLREPAAGELVGKMRIHTVRAGPGPLVTQLAGLLGLPTEVQLIDESVVHFTMQDAYVTHEGLEFQLGPVRVVTQGQIALADESLDMMADVQFPEFDDEAGPVRRAMSGRTISVPITGTLRQPKLGNGGAFPQNLTSILEKARELLEREGSDESPRETPLLDLLRRRRSPGDASQPPAAPESATDALRPELDDQVKGQTTDENLAEGDSAEDNSSQEAAESTRRTRRLPRLLPRRRE